MKYIILTLLSFFTISLKAQDVLKFDKRYVQCEDKWVAFPMDKDSTYTYGFIYIDPTGGLTFNLEGEFKINRKGTFKKIESEIRNDVTSIKTRLKPNRAVIAEIPESKFKQLEIEKVPSWLKVYKTGEGTIDRLYKWGYMYNGWEEYEKALTFLEKAEKIAPNYNGLQTELAFSYNALGKYDKAEKALLKTIEKNPNDCYSLKELAYTYNHLNLLDKSEVVYQKMATICSEKNYIQETAHNLAYQYFQLKNKDKFKFWEAETLKWSEKENQYTKNIKNMRAELDK